MRKFLAATALVGVLATLPAGAIAHNTNGNDYWVEVINTSNYTVAEIYATNRDDPGWGYDHMQEQGLSYIYSGQRLWVNMDDHSGYCMYDIMAVATNGLEWKLMNYNVCEMDSWRLRN